MARLKRLDVDWFRKTGFILALGIAVIACNDKADTGNVGTDIIDNPITADGEADTTRLPKIEFEQTEFSTGKIAQGEIINFVYKFKNTGESPLVISNVFGSCGCTIPRTYPRGRILPGEGGEIEVEFNSSNKWGEQLVSITVVTNTLPSVTQLKILTDIVVPDNMKTN
jgi:hypothetical protein